MYSILKSLIFAVVTTLFSLNALAADTMPLKAAQPAAAADASGEHKLTFQERVERMKSMTPEQRTHERELMRQEMQNMSPGQLAEQRKEIREHWEQMSPDERGQIRTIMKEHWKNMPQEQREERRKEMREHFNNMSPEERQQFKSDMNNRDGMLPQGNHYPGDKIDGAGSPARG
jgi:hypothetical protein